MWEGRTIARSPALRSAIESGAADGEEVQSPIERAGLQLEVAGTDRRDEAVVERLGDVEGGMDPIPARSDRELVCPQLAGVEQAEQLDAREVRLEEVAVLARVVLAQVPGVVGLLRARRGEGEPVRGRDVGGRRDAADRLDQLVRLVDVLDGLEEDDGLAPRVEVLDQAALEGEVRALVAGAGVLEGRGVRIGAGPL